MGGYSLVPRPSNRPAFDQIPLAHAFPDLGSCPILIIYGMTV